ncbi:MAG: putative permease, superfamily [Actinomycetia bacterium]|nr:putative permease, superfamily [Actinomycetes bacterium]
MVDVAPAKPRRLGLGVRRSGLRVGPYAGVWVAVTGWAGCALLVRAAHADAMRFTTWRCWFALPPLYTIVWLRARRHPGASIISVPGRGRAAWFALMAAAGALFAGGAATAFAALGQTTLLDATLIPSLQPVVIIAVAVSLMHERVARSLVVRCLVAVAGTALVAVAASGRGTWSLAGDLLALLSLFVNAGWHLYGRWVRHRFGTDPLVFMTGALTFAALFLTPLTVVATGGIHLGGHALGYAAAVMVTGTCAHITMVWAHKYVPASESAPVLLAEPSMVAIAGWTVFGDAPGALEIVGSLVAVGALIGVVRSPTIDDVEDAVEPTV